MTSTDGYGYSGPSHYDAAGYADHGRRFAEAVDAFRRRAWGGVGAGRPIP